MTTLNSIYVSANKKVYIKQANDIDLFYVVLTQRFGKEEDVLQTKSYTTLKGAQRFATTIKNRG